MIVDAILTVFFAPAGWLLDLIPSISWPSWFQTSGPDTLPAKMAEWGEHVGTLNAWFPVGTFFAAGQIVFVAAAAALVIRVGRILVSLFSGGGGSAA